MEDFVDCCESDPMVDYSRPLGNTEENWLRAVNGGTGNTVVGVLLNFELKTDAFQNAVEHVQMKHPRLLSQLTFADGKPQFQTSSSAVLEVEVIENLPDLNGDCSEESSEEFLDDSFEIGRRASLSSRDQDEGSGRFKMSLCQDHWLRLVEAAMNEPWKCDEDTIKDGAASLLCFRLYRLHEGRTLMLFRANTAICDRKSAGIIVEDILVALDAEVNGDGLNVKEAERDPGLLKPVEDCIPPNLSKKPFWAHGLDVVGYGLNSRRYSWLPFHDTASQRQSALIRSGLSRKDTEKLQKACKRHNITMFGAITCAALKSVASVKELAGRGEHFAITTLLDCRPFLSHELNFETVGFYHSAMMHTHSVYEAADFWELASRCHQSTANAIENRKHYTDMGDLNMLMAQAIWHPQVTPSSSMRTSTICSFWDSLEEKMQTFVDRLGVEDYVGCSSIHGVGPCLAIFDSLREDGLHLSNVYPTPLFSHSLMRQLVSKMMEYLQQECDAV